MAIKKPITACNIWDLSILMKTVCALLLVFLMEVHWSEASQKTNNDTSGLTKLSLEELMEIEIETVYGASKYKQKVTEAPSSVTIVAASEIKKYGYRTLADILRSIRSFYPTYDRNYHYLGARGFGQPGDYNVRVLLLVDGHRINDNIYDSASIGTEFILDVDLIERVEIVRGPSSSIYGANAFFAVINVITRQGGDLQGPEISGEAGSHYTYKGRLSYGRKFGNDLEVLLSGSYFDSKGDQHLYFKEFDNPATHHGIAENSDGDQFYSFFSNLSFKDFTLQGGYVSRKKDVPTASYGTDFNDPRNQTIDARGYLDLKYEHNFASQLGVMARLYYDDFYYRGNYIYESVLNKEFSWGRWGGGELKLNKTVMKNHKVILGAEFINNFQQDQRNYDEHPYLQRLNDKRESKRWAFYIQDEWSILKNLILNAGVRHDQYETFGGTTNPRIGLIYNPFEKTTLKLLYGKAFRPPNVYELFYNDGGVSAKSNPDLKPETIQTYELIWEQYIGKYLRGTTSFFYYKMGDLINLQTDPADGLLVFKNVENVEAKGIELELAGKWPDGLEGIISYSFQKTKDLQTGEIITNSPKHLAKLNLIFPLVKEKVFAGTEVQYISSRKTIAGHHTDSFFITNLTLYTQNLFSGLEVSASVYNLFNEKYGDPGSKEHVQDIIKQDGIGFRFKMTYRF